MEETEVDLKVAHDPVSMMEAAAHFQKTGKRLKKTINTRDILFIVSGAFNGLDEIVSKRISKGGLGFGADLKEKDNRTQLLRAIKSEDLIQYGFESEFVGRLPVVAMLEDLEEEDLFKILKNRFSSVVTAKRQDFKAYDIDINFTDGALREIARMAKEEKTGARALVGVMEKLLVAFERKLPSSDVNRFTVTEELVKNTKDTLKEILSQSDHPLTNEVFTDVESKERRELFEELTTGKTALLDSNGAPLPNWAVESIVNAAMTKGAHPETMADRFNRVETEIRDFEKEFLDTYHIRIRFSEEAMRELTRLVLGGSEEALAVCRKIFQNYHHGLKLVMERTGEPEFTIPPEAISDPERFLNDIIQKTYRQSDNA
jgi:hypothetical protein